MADTAQQVIDDIDVRYPNSASLDSKINWINIILKEIYQDVGFTNIAETMTVANQPFYFLYDTDNNVDRIEYDDIEALTVNGIEYVPLQMNEKVMMNSYFAVDRDYFGIYPTPTKDDLKILIHYKQKPTKITTSATNAEIEIDDKFYELLKYGVMVKIAESEQDMISRNNFADTYNQILRDARYEMNTNFSSLPVIEDVMGRAGYGYNPSYRRSVSEVISNGI